MRHSIFPILAISAAFALIYRIIPDGRRGELRAAQAEPVTAQPIIDKHQADLIHRGKLIFDKTPEYASAFVGNKLTCNDCHLQSGTSPYAAPMINLAGSFTPYRR